MALEQSMHLVESFLNEHSVDVKQFKKDHAVLLNFDSSLNLVIAAEEDFIRMTSFVGKVPEDETLYYDLLAENFKSAGHSHYQYAINLGSDELLISLTMQSNNYEVNKFIKLIDDFITKSKDWMHRLNSMSLGISSKEEQSESHDDKDLALSEQFIKA